MRSNFLQTIFDQNLSKIRGEICRRMQLINFSQIKFTRYKHLIKKMCKIVESADKVNKQFSV
ncbi:hypothetical protein T4D_15727 [Trichinella pseudospiralis]|uniref:Uncharacterized protein n=1 Tax=Trichinella pseudospiralis TaxID=6337 RepID=A0A0V1FBM5_TRIPS|nr:hypothetical protein T4D_15727 [Trichinella pseudospiralis]